MVEHHFRDCWGLWPPLLEKRLKNVWFALLLGCHLSEQTEYSITKELVMEGANAVGGSYGTGYAAPLTAFEVYFWNFAMGHDDATMPAWWSMDPEPKNIQDAVLEAMKLLRYAADGTVYEPVIPDDNWVRIYHKSDWQQFIAP